MDVNFYQGFMGRILGYGDVWASNPGGTGVAVLKGVRDLEKVSGIIRKAIELEKMRSKIKEKIERLEEEYKLGRISEDKYTALKKRV